MKQSEGLVGAIKAEIKVQGYTYSDIAKELNCSERTIKRQLAEGSMTLDRIERLSDFLNTTIADLAIAAERSGFHKDQLTRDQENELAEDLTLLMVAVSVLSGMTLDEVVDRYKIPQNVGFQKLAILDRWGILDLLPGNRVRLRVTPNFNWIKNGPIQQFFQKSVEQTFFSSRFDKKHEELIVLNGIMTDASNLALQERLKEVAKEFNQTLRTDSKKPIKERNGTTMVLAVRKWQFAGFDNIGKQKK
ncbi:sigma factor-like helix-turn-helix DNA-binding protein [Neptuniibacter sp. QD37_11]|uniref:sigma factor-like helix-turn-helix DNA-binding protein n=1 Tax=Neptuniibacter sp. QD37_11 TaxID=3398209 RepID=UPI0039F5FE37